MAELVQKVRAEREESPDGDGEPVTFDLLLSLSHVPEAREALEEMGQVLR